MNEILFIVTILVSYGLVLLFYRLFGRVGLYAWVAFVSVVANIEVVECVDLFGLAVTLGNVSFCSINLATDILNENYGERQSRRAVFVSFASLFAAVVLIRMSLLFRPNASDFAAPALATIFDLLPRVAAASLGSMLVSNLLNTRLYALIARVTPHIYLRAGISTTTGQLLDSFLFTYGAFLGVFSAGVCLELALTTFAIKLIIAVVEIPAVYVAKKMKNSGKSLAG